MLHCPECGKNVEGDYIYCPVCGIRVREDFSNEEKEASLPKVGQSLETKIAKLREKIAETRHNEQIGWGSVGIAVMIVIALAIIHAKIATENVFFASFGSSAINYILANISMDLTLLSVVLVIAGVILSICSRRRRTKLLEELEDIQD